MNPALFFEPFFRQAWVVRLGWTLLHFLWQGTLIAMVFVLARALLLRSLTARARYGMACAALGAMTAAPLMTYLSLVRFRGRNLGCRCLADVPRHDFGGRMA